MFLVVFDEKRRETIKNGSRSIVGGFRRKIHENDRKSKKIQGFLFLAHEIEIYLHTVLSAVLCTS